MNKPQNLPVEGISINNLDNKMSQKRVKMFDLNDAVQVVAVRKKSDSDNHAINVNFYTEYEEMFIDLSFELEYEELEKCEEKFAGISNEQLTEIFNNTIDSSGLPDELKVKKQ